ncbi:hypothetical protein D1BOALGB6SA_500 [Olavius sp. associated proteobacterium Delta 1]|nr:hypothetical protein D1BOALGB6SA_500 [Olavius sp. associated proteobacterium Delta 1]
MIFNLFWTAMILVIETFYGLNSFGLSLRIPFVSLFFILPLIAVQNNLKIKYCL